MPSISLSLHVSETDLEGRYRRLQRCWMGFWLLLMAVSWRLWMPPAEFPAVPFAPPFVVPPALEWGLLAAVVGAVLFGIVANTARRLSLAMVLFVAAAAALVTLNQHRLQPWFYQAMLLGLLFASNDSRRGLPLMRWLAIGVYLYSSLGKFDFQFLHTVGQQFLDTTCGLVGLDATQWSEPWRLGATTLFPAVELLVAIGLMIRPTRLLAAVLGIAMHACTIVLLSPIGLGHQPGVLVWNAAMGMQLALLFMRPRMAPRVIDTPPTETVTSRRILSPLVGLVAIGLAMLLPLAERTGYWDHWTSWALYSPHNSRVSVQVHASAAGRLPPSIVTCLSPPDETGWRNMDLDRWSIESVGVPNYPQARFQLGVAIGLIQCYGLERQARIRLRGVADRWTGRRDNHFAAGKMQWEAAADQFWLNAEPRPCTASHRPPRPR
ncbi:hypothetical protein [Roseimaritima ulvae]|uniref:Vitamin K-dependent gamma-carboxylase n=1 Tax=Roseimaritima ulvae TaxID=980254 RepID=A0A5B9R1T5_9BACT|nr:hypothetical protein [Roseimaritima ulvae]QEG43376.1 hypothetical protein UC8_54240 [Roseimaritima ulvae]